MDDPLKAGSKALGLSLSEAQATRLTEYGHLLLRWNTVYNLTAARDPDRLTTYHLLDCLAVVAPLRRQLPTEGRYRLLDAGSGAGLPGVVLSIMVPDLDVVCVDSVNKKTSFVNQVAAELGIRNLRSEHRRLEDMAGSDFDVVTSRALSSLQDLVRMTKGAIAPQGMWMAMKGKRPIEEIKSVSQHAGVFHVEQLSVPGLAAERCLVWMRPLLPSHS